MNYKIDVSLSTNEIYTLTFDYTFDENVEDKTIRLQIGDLMVETQDRRVVFKTTSSATCIKSNVRLGNVSLYEGNFLDYDQHGEYTKESYLKGATLINLVTRDMYDSRTTTSVTREFTEDGFRKIAITGNGSQYLGGDFWAKVNFVNSSLPEDWDTVYTVIVFVRKNTFPSDISLQFSTRHKNTTGMSGGRDLKGEYDIIIKGGETGIYKSTSKDCYYNHTASNRYWGCFSNAWSDTDVAVVDRTDLVGCVLEYAVVVVKGDYYEDDITIRHFFEGIGCVKSPIVISKKSFKNLFYLKDYTYEKNGGKFYSKDGVIGFSGNFRGYTKIDAINGGEPKDNLYSYLPIGTYNFKLELNIKERITTMGYLLSFNFICQDGSKIQMSYISEPGNYGRITRTAQMKLVKPAKRVELEVWYGGNRDYIEILNFGVCEATYNINKLTSGNSYVDTPNDLELHSLYYYGNPLPTKSSVCDTLDLTTGTITRRIYKFQLNDMLDKLNSTGLVAKVLTINETEILQIAVNHYNSSSGLFPYQLENLVGFISQDGSLSSLHSQGSYNDVWRLTNIEQAFGNVNTLYFCFHKGRFTDEEVTNMTNSSEAISHPAIKEWLANKNFTVYHQATPYTEQIAKPKALRSYRDGSIVTDSQQLVPELVTTLPISNKFETTKLVSGKTYNVYFDGTATELNVGGETVVANPISPCEFTCGSAKTLTITGTDIANVMVVEKEQKNEQHEINATSIHISKIITTNGIHNIFDEYQHQGGTQFNNDYHCVSTRDRNSVKINGFGSPNYAGFGYYPNGIDNQRGSLPKGTYKFHCKVKVKSIGDSYRILLHDNPDSPTNANDGFATGAIVSTKLIEEINYIGYFGKATCMLFYTYYSGQEIEYYDISLIKLSDEDITSSESIPNINYEETISTPSEPIVLRSYGEVQDTYDISTGIVTKRVAQSVDSFDLGALSSPETHTVTFDNMPVIYENGTVEFYTEYDLYPIAKFEIPSLNLYDVSNLEANKQYTIRNAEEIYCNGQSVPVRDVMTFTTSQLAKGEMVINNSNDKEPMVIEGNFEGREIPSFVGTRSVEALEIGIDGAVNQPTFGKGGRK